MTDANAEERIRHYPCERCGAELAFQPGTAELACAYCGFSLDLEVEGQAEVVERDLEEMLARQAEQRSLDAREDRSKALSAAPEDLEVRCPSCHAGIVFQGTLTAQSCPYCDAPLQRGDVHQAENRVPVDAIVPFRLEEEDARAAISKWLRSLWLAPNRFARRSVFDSLDSIYLPYWSFDALTSTRYRGRTRKKEQTFLRTRRGSFQWIFDDVMIAADRARSGRSLARIESWPMAEAVAYRSEYLTGHLARTYDRDLAEGWKSARFRMEARLERETLDRIGGDSPRIDERETRWNALTYKHLLVPVYVVSLRHKEKAYRVFVNGSTGATAGDRPWSFAKCAAIGITLFVLSRIAAAYGIGI